MELLDIVDENGNYTGEVMERNKVHELNLLHWEVAVFVINSKKEILIQKRSPNKKIDPNKWGLCAGHVDSKESLEDAALREIEEEIGLKLTYGDLHILSEKEVKIRELNSHISRVYYVITNETHFNIQKEELSEVKWVSIDELINRLNNNDETLSLKSDGWVKLLNELKELNI